MEFKLVRIDKGDPFKIRVPYGTRFIGRGEFLDCHDIRLSEYHGELHVSGAAIYLRTVGRNPCFYRRAAESYTKILKKSENMMLKNGDQFGLLPDAYWYEVIVCSAPDGTQPSNFKERWLVEELETEYEPPIEVPKMTTQNAASTATNSQGSNQTVKTVSPPIKRDHGLVDPKEDVKRVKIEQQYVKKKAEEEPGTSGVQRAAQSNNDHGGNNDDGKSDDGSSDDDRCSDNNGNGDDDDNSSLGGNSYDDDDNDYGGNSADDSNSVDDGLPPSPPSPPERRHERRMYPRWEDALDPGEQDWDSPGTNCPLGTACLRFDPRHRQECMHPLGSPPLYLQFELEFDSLSFANRWRPN